MTDETRAEVDNLTVEYKDVETRLRASLVAEDAEAKEAETRGEVDPDDAETRELRVLQERASFGRYLCAFGNREPLTGAERELCEARDLPTGGATIPWDAILPSKDEQIELRADLPTPAPTVGNPVNQHAILPRVFARAAVMRLGVSMPMVGPGSASWPIVSTGQSPQFVAKGATKEAAAGSISGNVLLPKRLTARFNFQLEDEATVIGLEDTLQTDLRMALADTLDRQVLGAGDAQVRGFLATAANGGIADRTAPTNVVTFTSAAEEGARGVDGKFASSEGEVAWVCGTNTYRKLAGLIQSGESTSATERLRRVMMSFTTSANIPAPSANVQEGIQWLGGGGTMTATSPTWSGLRFIRDEATAATSGAVNVTAIMLCNFKVLRSEAYVRSSLKLS